MMPKHHRGWVVLALVLIASVAAATALTVQQRTDTATLFAERYSLPGSFVLDSSLITVTPATLGAVGAPGAPAELGTSLPDARMLLPRDHWVYSITVKEAAGADIQPGEYTVALKVDSAPIGIVHVKQTTLEAGAEGARVSFDLGTQLQTDALYFIEVRPFVQTGPTLLYNIKSSADGPRWVGVGAPIDGNVNATLTARVGDTLKIIALNDDAGTHNLGIKNAAGTLVNPPGWTANIAAGQSVELAWVPNAAGDYTYQCLYHPLMKGALTVSA